MQDDELQVSIGQLKAVATAFTKANTMRIDLTGSGTVLSFKLEEGKVVQLDTNGDTFEKIN
jgi:hypothetical protein